MILIDKHRELGISTEKEGFDYLMSTLRQTIRSYDFFVAWEKVLDNVSDVEIPLNILNSLVGKDDIVSKFKDLVRQYPEVVPVVPLLFAERNSDFLIADGSQELFYSFDRQSCYQEKQIDEIAAFVQKCGLLEMLSNKKIKDLVDYVTGVEVGLDTNARKNRTGKLMETIVETLINNICGKWHYNYLSQATVASIRKEFGKVIKTDKSNRSYDFAIYANGRIFLIEVNYFGGGGSKLKAVAGEFTNLSLLVRDNDVTFVWITDGPGWRTSTSQLFSSYGVIEHIFNLHMAENGFLENLLLQA